MYYYVYNKASGNLVLKTHKAAFISFFDSNKYEVVISDVSFDIISR
jgi:hypothetical protein